MEFKIIIEQLISDAKFLQHKIGENPYHDSYKEFIKYFKDIPHIKGHHLIISSFFVYGWMPRILRINNKNIDFILELINKIKSENYRVSEQDLIKLKAFLNNSIIGTSKLLHFVNPQLYPIWDSHVGNYLNKKKISYNSLNKPKTYLKYLIEMQRLVSDEKTLELYSIISKHFDYKITKMRALEFTMFETNRLKNKCT